MTTRFRDRADAGAQLAQRLMPLREMEPVVVALPRGGVPVAREIATALGAPMDVLAVRKLGAPRNPELARVGRPSPRGRFKAATRPRELIVVPRSTS